MQQELGDEGFERFRKEHARTFRLGVDSVIDITMVAQAHQQGKQRRICYRIRRW